LLGWSPGDDRELFTRDELIAAFTLEGISGGNAVFNPDKLDWFNQQHILRLSVDDLAARLQPVLEQAGLWSADLGASRRDWFHKLLELIRPRVKKLDQFVEELRPFLQQSVDYDQAAVSKHIAKPEIRSAFTELPDTLTAVVPFSGAALESALRLLADSHGVKAAALIHATRVAVTGRAVSPGLFEVLELMGAERVGARVRHAINFLPK
jgi:glutamyl/glutaminyl-tRNA synthetase